MKVRVWFSILLCTMFVIAAVPASAQPVFPDVISLPDGFQPEGIAAGNGSDFYVGSLANGAIFRGDFRTGEGEVLIPGETGKVAVGVEFDHRSGYLFVSGGATGTARIYNTVSATEVMTYQLSSAPVFINDVVVTKKAAYFTDSMNARLFVLPLGRNGHPPSSSEVYALPLTGDWEQVAGFNANGIEAAGNGKALIIVNSTVGALYRVNPTNGFAQRIDLGGASVTNGDGLLFYGKNIYVVRNRLNLIEVFRLGSNFLTGTLVKSISDPTFDVPTTVAGFGKSLFAANARFGTPPGPDVEYWITRVDR